MDPVTSFPHLTLRPLAVNWQGAFLTTSSSFPLVHCYQTDWPGIDSSPIPRTTAKHNIECLLSATHLAIFEVCIWLVHDAAREQSMTGGNWTPWANSPSMLAM
jgi:hypothetical protein